MARELLLAEWVTKHGWDVVIVSEVHCADQYKLGQLCKRHGWKVVAKAREAKLKEGGGVATAKGGVAIILTNPRHYKLHRHTEDVRGLVAVDLRSSADAFLPYLIVAVYLPPESSVLAEVRGPLLAKAAEIIGGARGVYGNRIILGGDFNMRLPRMYDKPRHSHDAFKDMSRGDVMLRTTLEGLGFAPVWGRSEEGKAPVNSRQVGKGGVPEEGGGREVCFIMMDKDVVPTLQPLDPVTMWNDSEKNSSHIPQAIVVALVPWGGKADTRLGEADRGGRWKPPLYGNTVAWDKVATGMAEAFKGLAGRFADPLTSLEDATALWHKAWEPVLDLHCSSDKGGGEARKASATVRKGVGGASARCEASDFTHNRHLPPELVAAIKKARESGLRCDRVAAKRGMKKFTKEVRRRDVWRLSELRRSSPKAFCRELERDLAPENPTLHRPSEDIPMEPGKAEPLERFTTAFERRVGQEVGIPPAVGVDDWMKWVRGEEAEPYPGLQRKIEPYEVMTAVWAMTHRLHDLRCPASGSRDDECVLCNNTRATAEAWGGEGDLRNPAPEFKPRLKPQAAIHGDLQAAFLAWARPLDREKVYGYRLLVATTISTLLNRYLNAGAPPDSLAEMLSVPIFKEGSPNKADPEGYRYTAMTGLLMKVMDLVITARVTHYATRVDAVSTAHQGAFMEGMGTDWHAWAAREAVLDAWRGKQNVFMVFIDFSKAYDMVHPEAMLEVLKRQGVPDKLLKFIRGWFERRKTRVRVNGRMSDPLDTRGGLGQGFISSPELFIAFINSLSLYLESEGRGLGIKVGGVDKETHIISLVFADDINCPTGTPQAAEEVLRLVEKWSNAWGMKLNVGIKKTAVLPLLHPGDRGREEELLKYVITLEGGEVVPYCEEYKYLGARFSRLLDMDKVQLAPDKAAKERAVGRRADGKVATPPKQHNRILVKFVEQMRSGFARYHFYNSVTGRMSPAARLQITKMVTLPSYLLSLVPWTKESKDLINRELLKHGRYLTGLGKSSPVELVAIMSGLPTAEFLLARERVRMLLTMQSTRHKDAPAVRVFNAVGAVKGSWRGETEEEIGRLELLGARKAHIIMGMEEDYVFTVAEIPTVAAVMAREYATVEQSELVARKKVSRTYTKLSQQKEQSGSAQAVIDTLLGGVYARDGEVGMHRATRLSALARVGGAGALLPKVTALLPRSVALAVASSWQGPVALAFAPLGPGAWRLRSNATAAEYRKATAGTLCPLCAEGVASPEHILTACKGRHKDLDMEEERRGLQGTARSILKRLFRLIQEAQGVEPDKIKELGGGGAQIAMGLAIGSGGITPHLHCSPVAGSVCGFGR